MKRIFVDTNVMLDVLLHREPFLNDSAQVLNMGFIGKVNLCTTPLSFANCLFVARKALGYANAIEAMKIMERQISITRMNAEQLHAALHANASDFEDMLQYYSAVDAKCDYIVTRNERHFPQSNIAVMSPSALLQLQSI